MGVDLGRLHAEVPQQFLHRAQVGAPLQQVGGEAVPQRVAPHPLVDPGQLRRRLHRALDGRLVGMVPSLDARARVHRQASRRKHPHPGPFLPRLRVFAIERVGHPHARLPRGAIRLPQHAHPGEVGLERLPQGGRQHHHPVLVTLPLAYHDLTPIEVQILDPQPQPFHQAQSGAVEHPGDQPGRSFHHIEEPLDLGAAQDHREPLRPPGADHVAEFSQRQLQDRLVEEQQGAQRLILGAGRHVPGHREVLKELADFGLRQGSRCRIAMEAQEPDDPVPVRLLGAQRVPAEPHARLEPLQPRRPNPGGRRRCDPGPRDVGSFGRRCIPIGQ